MKSFSKGGVRLAVALAACAGAFVAIRLLSSPDFVPAHPARAGNPSVLLITVDTLRADALGSYGSRTAATPTLDRLAAAGVKFTTAYAHNVVTLPSHANILSGRLPFEHKVRDNWGGRVPATLETLATVLKARGYRTGAFVSAFPLDSRFGLDQGFDVYEDSFADAARPAFLEQERRGAETVRLAQQWIDAGKDQPFFCWVHIYEPHFPYDPGEPLASRFAGRPYDGEVAAADAALAPLLDPFLIGSPARPTLIVFTSDHGESLGDHGEASHGIFAYEATLRVPLVFHGPPFRPASVASSPAMHVDVFPTILEALGIPAPPALPGRSLLATMTRTAGADRALYFEALSGMLNRGWAPLRGVLSAQTKYIDLPIPELYDLARDPGETRNLARSEPARVAAMRTLLERWPASERVTDREPETGEVRERLRSLGYVGSAAKNSARYTEEDDPKRLIELDGMLQEVTTLYLEGDLSKAIAKCRELVARRPRMAVSLLYLAHLERASGNLPAGVDALRKALAIDPDDAETVALLGAYLTESGRASDAVDLLDPFVRRPQPDTQVLVSAGLALARAGRADDGLSVLDRARAADPSNAGILVHIGTVHLIAGRAGDAQRAFEQAVALNPTLARAHSSLGVIAAERGDRAAAVEHWRRAVAIDPGEFRTVIQTGAALASRGRPAEARLFIEFFVSAAPPSQYAADLARAREWLARAGR
jgi:arylsulfatase A-like enzyme/Flp pilus assembly protein TadD